LDEIDARLDDTRVVSPVEGVILSKFVERGEPVQPGQPLLTVADPSDLQIKVDLPTRLVRGLHEGMLIQATMDANDQTIDAVLERIYPAADPSQHTVTVKLTLPPDAPAAPGMYATVVVPEAGRPAPVLPVIPTSALVWRGSQPSVYISTVDNRTELRLVRIGDRLGSDVVVLSGLRAGDRILTAPLQVGVPGGLSTKATRY
jgi:RND family efflux transporter MFP subunit